MRPSRLTERRGSQAGVTKQAAKVRYEGVSKRFGPNLVLDGVTLDLPGGQTTCVIGPSGSGKSTLLRCTNRLEEPDAGRIFMDDQEITAGGVDVDLLRARIGMVFQQFNLFPHLSVLDNVTLALTKVRKLSRQEAEQVAVEELRSVGLAGFESRRPNRLSGGQQQRVAIARALAMRPDVMLFDEATSALDPELIKGVLGIMRDLAAGGMTMIVVTHELRFAREVAALVAFLDEGRLVEHGPPAALFDDPRSDRLREFLNQVL